MKKNEPYYEVRIRYVEQYHDLGECFVFEGKWTNEDEWSLDSAFPLVDDAHGNKGVLIHYTALTKIRELTNMKIPFYFSKE